MNLRWRSPRLVNRQSLIDVNLKVSALIDKTGNWDMDMLTDLFPQNEVVRIRHMISGTLVITTHGLTLNMGFALLRQFLIFWSKRKSSQ